MKCSDSHLKMMVKNRSLQRSVCFQNRSYIIVGFHITIDITKTNNNKKNIIVKGSDSHLKMLVKNRLTSKVCIFSR